MPASIGVNLRVTGHCRQGGRKYMEDFFSVAYQQTEDEKDLEYAFFGIYDGHGGAEAAAFAKEHLMESIVKHRGFWSEDDEEVLRSIKDGFLHTHLAMWKIHDKWPKTSSGLPSTAGTTASIAFIRRAKIYIGHVGDSGITLGYQEPGCPEWRARPLTTDHKPECETEMSRIAQSGGKVVCKSGVPRVVWNRPRIGHKGPVRRSTPIDEIPFLAVARSLGDLWSYNSAHDEFVVSPTPDVAVIPIDTNSFRCLIFGTDGLYNMLSPNMAVHIVQQAEKHNEHATLSDAPNKVWVNPSKCLVEKALDRWSNTKMRADNTSVITLMLDPPGPPRAEVLRSKKNAYSSSGLQIETRYEKKEEPKTVSEPPLDNNAKKFPNEDPTESPEEPQTDISKLDGLVNELDKHFTPKPRESTSVDTRPPDYSDVVGPPSEPADVKEVSDIQINEVSSSSVDSSEEDNRTKTGSKKSLKMEKVTRKIGLRSYGLKCEKEDITSTRTLRRVDGNKGTFREAKIESTKPDDKKKRTPLGENIPDTSRTESRVLRERKNTPIDKSPMLKKKFALKKFNLNGDKRKLLQSVLFRGKDTPTKLGSRKPWSQTESKDSLPTSSRSENVPKTKENQRVLRNSNRMTGKQGPDPPEPVAKALQAPPASVYSTNKGKRADVKNRTKADTREVRKSTLAKKLRMHQDLFKAKLRGRSGTKKVVKEKAIRFKRSVGKRS